jgi:hypothetical protein
MIIWEFLNIKYFVHKYNNLFCIIIIITNSKIITFEKEITKSPSNYWNKKVSPTIILYFWYLTFKDIRLIKLSWFLIIKFLFDKLQIIKWLLQKKINHKFLNLTFHLLICPRVLPNNEIFSLLLHLMEKINSISTVHQNIQLHTLKNLLIIYLLMSAKWSFLN